MVKRGGEEIPSREFGGRLVRMLIRVLATHRGQFMSKDALADALWGERLPGDPAANLEVMIHRARRAVRYPALITTGAGGYAFASEADCTIDVEEFRRLVEAGRASLAQRDRPDALSSFCQAFEWWQGEPLAEDAYAEWAHAVRAEMERLQSEALEGAAQAALRMADYRRAMEFAEMAVAREPLREAGWLLLMKALDLSGDRAGALRSFEELEVEPSSEAVQLQLEILHGGHRADGSLSALASGGIVDDELKVALGAAGSAPARSLALSRMATFAAGADDYGRASRLAELALLEAADDVAANAEALAAAATIDMNRGRLDDAERRAEEALACFDRLGDAHGRARMLDLAAVRTFLAGHIRAGVQALAEVADRFEEIGDAFHSITARSTCGHGLVHMDRAPEGLAHIERALEIATDLRHREMVGYCLWHRSEALAAFRRGLEAAAGLPLFESWAASQLALVLVTLGRSEGSGTDGAACLGRRGATRAVRGQARRSRGAGRTRSDRRCGCDSAVPGAGDHGGPSPQRAPAQRTARPDRLRVSRTEAPPQRVAESALQPAGEDAGDGRQAGERVSHRGDQPVHFPIEASDRVRELVHPLESRPRSVIIGGGASHPIVAERTTTGPCTADQTAFSSAER